MARSNAPQMQFDIVVLQGGFDQITPKLSLKPGIAIDCQNWEQSTTGGYSRIGGYERFSGQPKPSAAQFSVITVTLSGTINVGDAIVGATSAATGTVISSTPNTTGQQLSLTQVTGTFQSGEDVTVSAVVQGSILSIGGDAATPLWTATQYYLAAEVYRALIGKVGGAACDGPTRGVEYLAGVTYAWRDNAAHSQKLLFKSTTAGWVQVPLGFSIAFTNGTAIVTEGATLTQGGVTAVVKRVSVESGAWGTGSPAIGHIIVATVVGGSYIAGAATSTGGGAVTLSGAQSAITIPAGGRVQTYIENFGPGRRIYGCDGIGKGFEFDGTTYVPITTGNTVDVPTNVAVHKNSLFFSFAGGSLQHSGIGTPYNWTSIAGAEEFALGQEIRTLTVLPGNQTTGALGVGMDSSSKIVYGTGPFTLSSFEQSAGAVPYGNLRLGGDALMFGSIGVYSLQTTLNYGNFESNSLTQNIRPFTQQHRNQLTASVINSEKSQARYFFADGYALWMTKVGEKVIGTLPMYLPDAAFCSCDAQSPDHQEVSFIGSNSGYVFQLESGTSFDGQPINAYFKTTYAFQKSPEVVKTYLGASFEIQGSSYTAFGVTWNVAYGQAAITQAGMATPIEALLSAANWDSGNFWDTTVVWDGVTLVPDYCEIGADGENLSLTINCNSAIMQPFTINSYTTRYFARNAVRH